MSHNAPMVHVDVLGVRQRQGEREIVVLLLDGASELVVPIVVGPREANAIATAQSGMTAPRPMTHDLLCDVLEAVQVQLTCAEIVALDDGVFYAELVLSNGQRLDARASDAIAVAIRTHSPVLCSAEVVATSGVEVVSGRQREDLERFRTFLDHVVPEDFT
ncbi:bifunctional nuclease family protein [Paraoerskovia marina]|uniref:bifunctional nuclease family protein n=1 Tax=Paraoerskovia marina TaxID=545619 RepID=UPI000AE454F0